jgi:decaprenylphospho-beta-D-erythro-pentofuranosid-2-ulose 2-reductase
LLNSLGEYQKILILGGKSDLALSLINEIPLSEDSEVLLAGNNISSFKTPPELSKLNIERIDINFRDIEKAKFLVASAFDTGDVDLVIIAYAILGDEISQLDPSIYENVLHTNFYSQALMLNQVYNRMALQHHGQILLISSVAGVRPRKRNFVYGTSKSSVDFLVQGLQKLTHDSNISLTILRPGFVHTKMTTGMPPAPFATDKVTVAKIAARALRNKSRIAYAPRILFFVMPILKILPERIFRLLDR